MSSLRELLADCFRIAREEGAIKRFADGVSDTEEVLSLIAKRVGGIELPDEYKTDESGTARWAWSAHKKAVLNLLKEVE